MLRRKRSRQDDTPGQDSFLDVVANLVGILIILVMVVGARAKDVWMQSTAVSDSTEVAELKNAVQISQETTAALETDINRIAQTVKMQDAAVARRRAERNQIQLTITAAERELLQQREQLNTEDRQVIQLRNDLRTANDELNALSEQRRVVENSIASVTVIEHIPTPMAKTVFGKEVHFRLLGGRLAYVPLDELVEKMKGEIRVKAEKLRNVSQTSETVGPIAGFHLRYILQLQERIQQTQFGQMRGTGPEFVGFFLIPTSDQLGEPIERALQPGSQFLRWIDGLNPDTATITVWVYPDSFNEFLVLKRELFQQGFLTASRPLPEGQPISGGPHGRRSAAQ